MKSYQEKTKTKHLRITSRYALYSIHCTHSSKLVYLLPEAYRNGLCLIWCTLNIIFAGLIRNIEIQLLRKTLYWLSMFPVSCFSWCSGGYLCHNNKPCRDEMRRIVRKWNEGDGGRPPLRMLCFSFNYTIVLAELHSSEYGVHKVFTWQDGNHRWKERKIGRGEGEGKKWYYKKKGLIPGLCKYLICCNLLCRTNRVCQIQDPAMNSLTEPSDNLLFFGSYKWNVRWIST